MKNHFAEDYKIYEELKRRYSAATTADERDAVRKAHSTWYTDMVETKGQEYEDFYRIYSEAQERGNEYFDISEPFQYSEPKKLVDTLRELGVERFTFSSTWSRAVETAWEFVQAGCTMEGMVRINGFYMTTPEEYEKKPAYLFKVN